MQSRIPVGRRQITIRTVVKNLDGTEQINETIEERMIYCTTNGGRGEVAKIAGTYRKVIDNVVTVAVTEARPPVDLLRLLREQRESMAAAAEQ
jgi:hypothetical protein